MAGGKIRRAERRSALAAEAVDGVRNTRALVRCSNNGKRGPEWRYNAKVVVCGGWCVTHGDGSIR
jgi:hypothetical protein